MLTRQKLSVVCADYDEEKKKEIKDKLTEWKSSISAWSCSFGPAEMIAVKELFDE